MLLVHGLASSLDNWQTLIPGLVSAGYKVYAVDLLGHGESHKPTGAHHYRIETIFSFFVEWINRLDLEAPPILIGHSLGGYLSLSYAIQNPERVRGFVLIDPFYSRSQLTLFWRLMQHRPDLGEKTLRLIPDKAVNALINLLPAQSSLSMETTRQTALDYRRASPQIFHIPRTIHDLTPHLSDVHSRGLVIWGEKDLTLAPASFQLLVQNLPNATGHSLPGGYHQPHLSRPEEVRRLILNFLDELD